jgi:hypothetical protein
VEKVSDKKEHKKRSLLLPLEASAVGILLLIVLGSFYVIHCVWAAAEAYSAPSIVLSSHTPEGVHVFDDFREAYAWLSHNTDENDKVASWWDYGYQTTAMANQTVIVDNNTWNNTHIATVGTTMSSPERQAWEIFESLDVKYVLVVFGGLVVRSIFQPFEESAFTIFSKEAPDFSFAFNDSNFSDRVLQIQVLPDSQGDGFNDDMLDSITDCKHSMQTASSHVGSSTTMDHSNIGARVESLHVNSTILAQKSAFFYELFSKGIEETEYHSSDKFFGGNDIHGFIAVYVEHNFQAPLQLRQLLSLVF